MNIHEYLREYGTGGTTVAVRLFILRCPDFPGSEQLAAQLGKMLADLESALESI